MLSPRFRLSLIRAYPLDIPSAWIVSAMLDNRMVTRTFYGLTRQEALAEFRAEFPDLA